MGLSLGLIARGEKQHKQDDQRHHNVVVKRTPLVLPQNISAGFNATAFMGRGALGATVDEFGSMQVY